MALSDNLVSWYNLNSNSNDSVSSYNGTDTAMSYSTAGKIGNGGTFNGSSSKIDLPTTSFNTAFSTDISISMWVKFNSTTTEQILFALNSVGNDSPEIRIRTQYSNPNVTFEWVVYDNGAYQSIVSKVITYDTNWHHVLVVGTTNDFRIYVDGVLGGVDTSGSFNIDSIGELCLGRYSRSGAYFNGMLDEVGIWSRALTEGEVSSLYNSGNGISYPFGTAYTLSLAYNAFVLTGYASTLTKALKMLLGYNAFSLTGIAVTLKRALQMLITYGTYALTGFDVELSNLKKILIDVGNFALTGYDATLRVCRCLKADVGKFILTGVNVILKSTAWGNDSKPSASIWTEDTKPSNSWTNDTK